MTGPLAAGVLATWRLTHLLAYEDGPAMVVTRMRARAGDGTLGQALACFLCLSVWVAAPVAVLAARRPRDLPLTWMACSGGACLLERALAHEPVVHEIEGALP